MGKIRSEIDEAARKFIEAQKIFFVASSPLDPGGHVNVSPKGHDTFRILGPTTVAYLDFNGSGVETIAHLKENGRIVLMFCAFQGPPDIFRLYGHGRVVEAHEADLTPGLDDDVFVAHGDLAGMSKACPDKRNRNTRWIPYLVASSSAKKARMASTKPRATVGGSSRGFFTPAD